MEPLTLFAATVGFIGAFHLLSTTVDHFSKGKHSSTNRQKKREEWYCFFQPSDLLGEALGTDENMEQVQRSLTEAEQLEKRRQQQANRPRLQL